MNEDPSDLLVHARKLIATDHPVLNTFKRLVHDGKNNLQVRGVLMLLLCHSTSNAEISEEQRKLAEIIEMIHTAHYIHKSVVDVPNSSNEDEDYIKRLQQLEDGNKISILLGDALMANAIVGIASFKIPKLLDLIAEAMIRFLESEFYGKQDAHCNAIPSYDSNDRKCWEKQWELSVGSLLSAGCESSMLLAKQPKDIQTAAKDLGLHTALAIQASDEIRIFTQRSGAQFSLCSAPVIFHLQEDKDLLDYIQQFEDDLSQVDYIRVYDAVISGDGIDQAKSLCVDHVHQSLEYLKEFPDKDGRRAYENLLLALI